MRSKTHTSEELSKMSRRELWDLAITKISKGTRDAEKLRASPYHDAREFMQYEADIQFKMDNNEFRYLDVLDKLK